MHKLIFFAPNGKLIYLPCDSLEQAREGREHLPPDSYFGIETPSGIIVEPGSEYEQAAHIIRLIKLASSCNREQ